ncbi:MAG: ATP-binding protein [Chloroflexi bacterium]|nr:ATP-binding protein [Chloroflexota bacterium]
MSTTYPRNDFVTSTGGESAVAFRAPLEATRFWPAPPQTIEETGLIRPLIEDHLIRLLYFAQQLTGGDLATRAGVPYIVIQPVVQSLVKDHIFEVVGQKSLVEAGYSYMLAPKGRVRADEALQRTWYRGPLPVPLSQYVAAIVAQSVSDLVVRRDALRTAFSDLVISEEFLDRIGPAVNAGQSIFLYGAPGNGKTAIAERITAMIGGAIFVPHAVEVDGSIIMVFDELNHRPTPVDGPRKPDMRWQRVRRPVVVAGGELTLSSLDLTWNDVGKFYEAPLQMKANGGTFLIDDFGRQIVRPVDLLNRWIVPLEKQVDFLTLMTGKKLEIPFNQLLIFSTNLNPADLTDEAFQRRVRFRIPVEDPTREQFAEVFKAVCDARRVPFDPRAFQWLVNTWWAPYGRPFRMVQPRDLVNQLIAIAKYLGKPPAMDPELLNRACQSYFVVDTPPAAATAARMS